MRVPFAEKGDLSLKKIGIEVIVRVGPQKRTIMLPPALAAYSASGARFEDGTLEISFEKSNHDTEPLPDDEPFRSDPPPPPPRAVRPVERCSWCSTACAGRPRASCRAS